MRSVSHYVVLGAYFGAVVFVVSLIRAAFELPAKLRESSNWSAAPEAFAYAILAIAFCLLLGAGIGGLVGWAKLHAEKRARAS